MQRRQFRRVKTGLRVEYSLEEKPSREAQLVAYTKDVGAKGMCFSVKEDIPLNTILSLNIYLADNAGPIAAKARVVWKGKFTGIDKSVRYDIGVDITEIDEGGQKRLRQHLFDLVDTKKKK